MLGNTVVIITTATFVIVHINVNKESNADPIHYHQATGYFLLMTIMPSDITLQY